MIDTSSPRGDSEFVKYWELFVGDVSGRENVKMGHLKQLELLCEMYLENDHLSGIIELKGYTYEAGEGRNGNQLKLRPEVQQLNRLRAEIRAYSIMLGLTLVKDTIKTKTPEAESW